MAITAKQVADLRAKTGVGMMECKKALTAANGDDEEAIKILREKGLSVAAKKSGRVAAEGVVDIAYCDECKTAAMIEVNIETDFAAKNETFANFVKDILGVILKYKPADINALNALPFSADMTVEAAVKDKIFTIGENINIRRFTVVEGTISTYVHGKGAIGVIVKMAEPASDNPLFAEAAKNMALQIAAMGPQYLDEASVPASVIESEKEIIAATIKNDEANAKKPANIIDKMVLGKLSKFYETNCLLLQSYVKDDQLNVKKYLASVSAEIGSPVAVEAFYKYERGEGIEKKEENYAEEIAKLAGIATK
ncbi:Elongation factor Ts [bioreactor metagenome]|uniref:Elongation factor Ts n=1 Tax=bioreactor metagenome TaxID=1076179 RepID=A0A644YIX7_9ZZZZ|nr:translation elongation factor Ts [Oscillospiraceae bacterium]